jgi:hypothetical protein
MTAKKKKNIQGNELLLGLAPRATAASGGSLKMVTNQRNLFYMLAAGLIMSPKGFAGKHYVDSLSTCPGWVPLFPDRIPSGAFDQAASEGSSSIACVMMLNLTRLNGPVRVLGKDGLLGMMELPGYPPAGSQVVFVPTPLPAIIIESIEFRTKEEMDRCVLDAMAYGNVPLHHFKLKFDGGAYRDDVGFAWPPEQGLLPDLDQPMDVPLAVGGVLAMLAGQANRSEMAIIGCRAAFDSTPWREPPDSLLEHLGAWCGDGKVSDDREAHAKIFWEAVQRVAVSRSDPSGIDPLDALLEYLSSEVSCLDDKLSKRLGKLVEDIRGLAGFSAASVTDLFERHLKPFPRALILFSLCDSCVELLDFRHPALSPTDYLVASILFAARDTWLGVPSEFRNMPGLYQAVSQRVAASAHRLSQSGVSMGEPLPRPVTLRELFAPSAKGVLSPIQTKAALEMAQRMNWKCVRTMVDIRPGEFKVSVDARGVHIQAEGDLASVRVEPEMDEFQRLLGEVKPGDEIERDIRLLLEGGRRR